MDEVEELHSLSRINTSMQWQKSRLLWLKEGDANSKFFHGIMSSRRRANSIVSLSVNGIVVDGVADVRSVVFNHFSSHFRSVDMERPSVSNLDFKKLNLGQCGELIKPFTVEEVKHAVWDCDNFKSPGPDGVNSGFMRFISEFHRNGKLSKGLNGTFIALIPKVESPQRLNDFRPISMVGSLYKVLSKVLANRLRVVMSNVISETQSAFIHGRQILDGILIASELVEDARHLKKDLLLFKVDFEKTFDSIDWSYLEVVMKKMNFPTLWHKWILECITTTSASVLVNGCPTDEFRFERGLRQGDPLSPFLFLIAAEGLHVMMNALVEAGLFTSYKVGADNLASITHLQFADDTLLVGDRSWANIRALKALLLLFEASFGLKVNFHKSMLLSVNIHDSWLAEAAFVLNCKLGHVPFLYLGLPIGGDSHKLKFWQPLIDRIKSRLSGWKSKNLSFGGRLVLLKFVLSSLPIYFLSFFKAPSGIISSIESLFNCFFWGK